MKKTFWLLLLSAALLICSGCGLFKQEKSEQEQREEAAKDVSEKLEEAQQDLQNDPAGSFKKMGEAMEQLGQKMNEGAKVEPVDFKELKALLPASLSGMERGEASGEKTSAMGMKVSRAEADYSGGDGGIHIALQDMGTLSGMAAMAFSWAFTDLEKDTGHGFERTTTYRGHRAFEKYDENDREGEISVLVAKRFLVEVRGHGVAMEDLRAALGAVDVGQLAGMKDQGITK